MKNLPINRVVINGTVTIKKKAFTSDELKHYERCGVVLVKSINGSGYDVYYKTHFICYVEEKSNRLVFKQPTRILINKA